MKVGHNLVFNKSNININGQTVNEAFSVSIGMLELQALSINSDALQSWWTAVLWGNVKQGSYWNLRGKEEKTPEFHRNPQQQEKQKEK